MSQILKQHRGDCWEQSCIELRKLPQLLKSAERNEKSQKWEISRLKEHTLQTHSCFHLFPMLILKFIQSNNYNNVFWEF
jgi:hypothetical protein